jgi:RNA polymerase sigma-70 factor (ECF subfamily)
VDAYLSSVRLPALPTSATEPQAPARPTAQPEPVSDELLMSRLRVGEQEAIAELFRRHSSCVYHIGKRMLRDSGEADDLVQEVFLYVYRRSKLFDASKGPARSWIFQVAYTQALLKRRKLKSIGLYRPASADDGRSAESLGDLHANYDDTVEGLFGRNAWTRVVHDLTKGQRETLRLHFFEGYTFAEIAEKLGQSYANIRNHHYRGLEKLREHLVESARNRR